MSAVKRCNEAPGPSPSRWATISLPPQHLASPPPLPLGGSWRKLGGSAPSPLKCPSLWIRKRGTPVWRSCEKNSTLACPCPPLRPPPSALRPPPSALLPPSTQLRSPASPRDGTLGGDSRAALRYGTWVTQTPRAP